MPTKQNPNRSTNRKSYIRSQIEIHVIGYRKSTKCACGTYNPLTPPLVRGENTTHGGKSGCVIKPIVQESGAQVLETKSQILNTAITF